MTTTVDALPAIPADPSWCSGHYEPSPGEAFHTCDFATTWGTGADKVGIGLVQFDSDGSPGESLVEVSYSPDGRNVEGSASLDNHAAREMAGSLLLAVAAKRRVSRNRLTLLMFCAYEAGKAFAAAVKSARASSPVTASAQRPSPSSR